MALGVTVEPTEKELGQSAKPAPVVIQSPGGIPPVHLQDPAYKKFIDSLGQSNQDKSETPATVAEKTDEKTPAANISDDPIKLYMSSMTLPAPAAKPGASVKQVVTAIGPVILAGDRNDAYSPDRADPDSDTTSIRTISQEIARSGKGKIDPNEIEETDTEAYQSEVEADQDFAFETAVLEDYREDQYETVSFTIADYDKQIYETNRDMFRRLEHMQQNREEAQKVDQETNALGSEKTALTAHISETEQALADSEAAAKAASATRQQRFTEIYKTDHPTATQAADNDEAESSLHDAAMKKYHDDIAAEYKAKGLEAEFDRMERGDKGEHFDQAQVDADMKKVRAAGMSGFIDVALVDKLRRDDPSNPYLKTLSAADADETKAVENRIKADQNYHDAQSDDVRSRLGTIDTRLIELEQQRTKLSADKDADEKALQKLKATEAELKQQKEAAVKYQTWLNDDKTKEGIANGSIKLEDFKNEQKKDGYTPPNQSGLAAKTADASWSTTSNAGSTIKAAPVGDQFASAVTGPKPDAETPAPAPQPVLAMSAPAPWQRTLG